MKKFLTALIAFVMCFSVVTTAFAATPYETSDSDLISDIKQAMLDTYYGDEKPEYLNVEILLDDEDEVYFSFSDSFATSANRVYTEAGNYSRLPTEIVKIIYEITIGPYRHPEHK